MAESPYPEWLGLSDRAKADLLVLGFVDAAFDHRASCPTCISRLPCKSLRALIDRLEIDNRSLYARAWEAWLALQEEKYGTTIYQH